MLLRFAASNHLSIREPQALSFTASALQDRTEGLIRSDTVPNKSVLPALVVYGANASGKSNLVDAIAFMKSAVLGSHTRGEPGGGVPRRAFRLDASSSRESSTFEIDFAIDDVRHHYGFEASDTEFVSEWLYTVPKSHRRMLFEREDGSFRFGRELRGPNNSIARLTRPNSLFLSAAAQNGHDQLSGTFDFFRSIGNVTDIAVPDVLAVSELGTGGPDQRVIDFLAKVGTGVVGHRRNKTELSERERAFRRKVVAAFREMADGPVQIEDEPSTETTIELAHRSREGQRVYLELERESAGTRRLLVLLGFAFRALDSGAPLVVDELGASLHTYATASVLGLFCSPQTNPKGAQLVATTHDTNLLTSPYLRRDQVWFAEKDPEGATQVYPLTDIRTRKGDNLELGYLQGRYGAIPAESPVLSAIAAPK